MSSLTWILVLERGRIIRRMDRNALVTPGPERALEDVLGGVPVRR